MLNPSLIADRQRDIKVMEGKFADYPGAKWQQRDPSSTAFGDASIAMQAAVQGRRTFQARYNGFSNVVIQGGRRPRYNGYGGFSRFGSFGDDVPEFLAPAADTPDYATSIGFTGGPSNTSNDDSSGPSWSDVKGFITDAGGMAKTYLSTPAGQSVVQNVGGSGAASFVKSLFGPSKPPAPGQPASKGPSKGLIIGGAALALGAFLFLKK